MLNIRYVLRAASKAKRMARFQEYLLMNLRKYVSRKNVAMTKPRKSTTIAYRIIAPGNPKTRICPSFDKLNISTSGSLVALISNIRDKQVRMMPERSGKRPGPGLSNEPTSIMLEKATIATPINRKKIPLTASGLLINFPMSIIPINYRSEKNFSLSVN
jgi:hypothetical protein